MHCVTSARKKPIERKESKVGFAEHASFKGCGDETGLVRTRQGTVDEPQQHDCSSDHSSHVLLDKAYMKTHCFREGFSRFALKTVRNDIEGDWKIGATMDLAKEAKFLACLAHPNIIKMRGTMEEPGHKDFGIILDRMVTTLDKAILEWKKDAKRHTFSLIKRRWGDAKALELNRLLVLYDISRAMRHLHKNK